MESLFLMANMTTGKVAIVYFAANEVVICDWSKHELGLITLEQKTKSGDP